MSKLLACILKPRGPFHAGEREGMREGSTDFIHSDTIFSALCHSLLLLYGQETLERFLASENSASPPLLHSSAFPYWQERYYLPVPRTFIPASKETKRVRFVELAAFASLLDGSADDAIVLRHRLPDGTFSQDDVPKVTISRFSGTVHEEGGFYHVGLTWYHPDAALYFLFQAASDWQDKVTGAIRLMADEGIGGYRSIGRGQFHQPVFQELTIPVPANANAEVLLSLYYPTTAETAGLATGWYDLVTRKGYVYSPLARSLRRKSVTLFAEGSVFSGAGRKGTLVDVTPDNATSLGLSHKVYRSGLGLCLPCRTPTGGSHA